MGNKDKSQIHSSLAVFETKQVRTHWDETEEKWYFAIVDVIEVLTESSRPRKYWNDLKSKLKKEGSELSDQIGQLKLKASDGKMYITDVANTEQVLRLIQSIPSPKAEPFKLWLAKVGYERMQEIADPSQSIDRGRENWQKLGRSEKWIQQRMTGQETRNKLTDYWKQSGIEKKDEFALLTNIIHEEWTGLSVKKHKDLKGLKSQNLRDHMSEAELIFTALAELSTRKIAETEDAQGLGENAVASKLGGAVAKNARTELESKTGKSVVTGENFLAPKKEIKQMKSKKKK
ncbi:BRO family, N-terminal domain protein [Leptospira wolbachii serovar Codice str. CDC]|uniref:BRO family, N-terminal domain protein n=1 Tax=Leptospira wolbachii serovar Codice str. CDC TaxID=1218599 RepID=R9A8Q6_9LEPT|nr:Bro-N domain-containing protein [Leptospira wolbachii]EOQ98613.1 BRO family, N-terminal domain protein [Leptospira wolbachii serovar Codice str. CDC]